jgi:hypothetical protein
LRRSLVFLPSFLPADFSQSDLLIGGLASGAAGSTEELAAVFHCRDLRAWNKTTGDHQRTYHPEEKRNIEALIARRQKGEF